MTYDLGAVVLLTYTARDLTGVAGNATSVSVTITLPDLTSVSSGVLAGTAGVYAYAYPTTQAGRHTIRWVATGTNAGAYTDVFEVNPAQSVQLVSLADARNQLRIPAADTSHDAEIADFLRSVTAVVERYKLAVVATTRTDTFDGGVPSVALRRFPVLSVSSVSDFGTVLPPGSYEVNLRTGVLTRVAQFLPYPFLPGSQSVSVTYVAGSASTPPDYARAALIILQHMWETMRPAGRAPFSQQSDDYDPRYSYSIPRRALELLGEPVGGFA